MVYFIWEKRLDTGIEIIDQQHQRIALYINDLHAAIKRQDDELEGDTLIKLLDYTHSHLNFEEELLGAVGYPELKEHKAMHALFKRRIDRYFKQHYDGKAVATPLISELKMWLTTHILYEDNDYAPYIERYLRGSESGAASSVPTGEAASAHSNTWLRRLGPGRDACVKRS